jgi:hypothetical protein
MRTNIILVVIASLIAAGIAFGQAPDGVGPAPQGAVQGALPPTDTATIAPPPAWETRQGLEDAAKKLGELGNIEQNLQQSAPEIAERAHVQRITILRTVRQGLSQEEFDVFLAKVGGPASGVLRDEVKRALSQGLVSGRRKGTTIDDQEWQSPCTKQEATVIGLRADDASRQRLQAHDDDVQAHGELFVALTDAFERADGLARLATIIALIALGLVVGLLLYLLVAWFLCRATGGAVVLPAVGPGGILGGGGGGLLASVPWANRLAP